MVYIKYHLKRSCIRSWGLRQSALHLSHVVCVNAYKKLSSTQISKGVNMADAYFHMWVTVTSLVIIVLVLAYIIYDRIVIRYEKLIEQECSEKTDRLNSITMAVIGACGAFGGSWWYWYLQTHEIYITKSLRGFHDDAPALLMGIIGLFLLVIGLKRYRNLGNIPE